MDKLPFFWMFPDAEITMLQAGMLFSQTLFCDLAGESMLRNILSAPLRIYNSKAKPD